MQGIHNEAETPRLTQNLTPTIIEQSLHHHTIPKSFSGTSSGSSRFFNRGDLISEELTQFPTSTLPFPSLSQHSNDTKEVKPYQTNVDIDTNTKINTIETLFATAQANMVSSPEEMDDTDLCSLSIPNRSNSTPQKRNALQIKKLNSELHQQHVNIWNDNRRNQYDLSEFSNFSTKTYPIDDLATFTLSPPTYNHNFALPVALNLNSNIWVDSNQRTSISSVGSCSYFDYSTNSIPIKCDQKNLHSATIYGDSIINPQLQSHQHQQQQKPHHDQGLAPAETDSDAFKDTIASKSDMDEYFGTANLDQWKISLFHFNEVIGHNLASFNGDSLRTKSHKFALVGFKNARLDLFCYAEYLSNIFKEGDYVVVQADRGSDMGKLAKIDVSEKEARLFKTKQLSEQGANLGKSITEINAVGLPFPRIIVSKAEEDKFGNVFVKRKAEQAATAHAQQKLVEYGLNLVIYDCEYQWDMNKMTFYYHAAQRVDFRELIRNLFRTYKARIWLSKTSCDLQD